MIIKTSILAVLLINSFSILTKESNDTKMINEINEPKIISKYERNNSLNDEYLDTDIEDTPYDENNINFTLYVQSTSEIENTEIINDGMTQNNSITFNDNYEVLLNYTVSSEKASSTIKVNLANSNTLSLTIYSYRTDYGVFLNSESLELAEDNYYSFLLYNDYITEDDYANYVNPKSLPSIEKDEETIADVNNVSDSKVKRRKNTTTFLEGTISWIDDEYNLSHPLSGIMVEIYDKDWIGSQYLGFTYTNENGFYSFSFQNQTLFENGGYDIFIRVCSKSENSSVVKSLFFDNCYYVQSEVTENVTTGKYYNKSMTINMDTKAGKAIQIAQALSFGNEYVKEMNDDKPAPYVSAKYPTSGSYQNFFGLHYAKDDYKFWDILLHEYGHHLQEWMGITNSPGGTHYIGGDCIKFNGKNKGIRLAWGEAWPTVFALQVTDYFSNRLKNIRYICDNEYNSSGDPTPWSFDLENVYSSYGEGCEGTIMAVLYDLYDEKKESFDEIALGHQELWNIMKSCKSKTFSQFANYIYENDLLDKNLFGKLLSNYGMSAKDLYILKVDNSSKIPSFKWSEGGNYSSSASKSNKFNLEFFDFYGKTILTTADIFSNEYKPSLDEWNKIINAPGNTYYISIKTYQTSKPATGVYYSEYYDFIKPDYDQNRYILYPTSYQYTESYGDTNTKPIKINDLVITTERKRCGFIEGEYINLSPRKQGQGEAYISYHLNKKIYKVEVNLSLWGKSEYLNVLQSKVAIQTLDESGNYQDKYIVDIDSLPTDRTCPNLYAFTFDYGITDFRIYVKTFPIGTANKGRVSIGNMSLYY